MKGFVQLLSMISNRAFIDCALTFHGGYCGFPGKIKICPADNEYFWDDFKTRIEEFLYDISAANERYKGRPSFPYPYPGLISCEIIYVVLSKNKRAKTMKVYITYETEKHGSWYTSVDIRIDDFCNPSYISEYTKKLRSVTLEKLEGKIRKNEEKLERLKKTYETFKNL